MMFGAVKFFSKQGEEGNRLPTLQKQQPSMGFVVVGITIPLIIVECFLLASSRASQENRDLPLEVRNAWSLIVSDKVVFLLQKIIQAIIYCSVLRYKTFRPHFIENAKFYLKVLAFFNFIEWVDSQVNEDSDVESSGAKLVYKHWFDVFITFYKALIIDYRLLCSLLFLEHALEDANGREVDLGGDVRRATARRRLSIEEEKHRTYGFMIGFISFSSPLLCAWYYVPALKMPPWVHVFSIALNLTIIVFGAIFLTRHGFAFQERDDRPTGLSCVKITVCCLGAVGFICWLLKGNIVACCAITDKDIDPSYFAWVAPKYLVRGLTTAFLIFLFVKLDALTMPQENGDVLRYHFQVSAMMLMILATFLECLIDQYVGPVDSWLRKEIHDLSLNILFDVGPAMSLGFLIHLFLHFVIIASKTPEQPHQPEPEPEPETQIAFRNPVADIGSVRSSMGSLISNEGSGNENVA
ncbi:PREDICTED: uncharacterized protein LOC107334700 [Acropora digitifera]|uniref:uncharacterized protein LOC107334700 n=1 Tax=Acropora digitifera TaxID=70779 RepID=UPI00077A4659|nr:PREDICTED: uncharacterized protein LOC107334700 [Acropora digitifera]